jgi:hypothetical protein
MRASELRGLTWGDVDFERKVVTVRQRADRWGAMGAPKSAAGRREIPMSPMVVNVLREWRLACPKGPLDLVFPNSLGRHEMHFRDHGLNRAQLAAGITDAEGKPRYSFHALRHFCASWLIEQEFSAKRIQAWLGHSSITMTFDTYGHLFPSLEDDHAKLAAGELAVVGWDPPLAEIRVATGFGRAGRAYSRHGPQRYYRDVRPVPQRARSGQGCKGPSTGPPTKTNRGNPTKGRAGGDDRRGEAGRGTRLSSLPLYLAAADYDQGESRQRVDRSRELVVRKMPSNRNLQSRSGVRDKRMQVIPCPRCGLRPEVTANLPPGMPINDPVDRAEIGNTPVDWRSKCKDQNAVVIGECSYLRSAIRAAIVAAHGRL